MRRLIPILAIASLAGCIFDNEPDIVKLSGKTMGTTYNITAIGDDLDRDDLNQAIETALNNVNATMSNWDPNSEVSTFSKSTNTTPMSISPEFATVVAAANDVHSKSLGIFDVTLGPLIELWGFGPRKPEDPVPSDAQITDALDAVGQARLITLDTETYTLAKSHPGVGINLSAIAKGYGIDAVAQTLIDAEVANFMVEIGGDLRTSGKNEHGEAWRIGIEKPEPGIGGAIQMVVPISNSGMATSGDYRIFFEHEGKRFSHIIDPTTGRPITHQTTSVTVLAESAMMADAWATAMLAIGAERGLKVAEANNIPVFFISRDVNGGTDAYITVQSRAFTKALAQEGSDQ